MGVSASPRIPRSVRRARHRHAARDRGETREEERPDPRDADELHEALLFNRKLWTILLTAVTSEGNQLSAEIRQNVANLGVFVMKQTVDMTGEPHPEKLRPLININRELAAGLLGRG